MKLLKHITAALALISAVFTSSSQSATFTIDSGLLTNGHMNVFNLDGSGVFGSGWGIGDLSVTFLTSSKLKFTPNSINDPNSFWYTPSGGPGAQGNKIMEANLYHQSDGLLAGQTVTFEGSVTAFNLPLNHEFRAFVRDFSADYSTMAQNTVTISSTGNFSVSLNTINDATRHVQFGLQMKGVNVWSTDIGSAGAVEISAIPEPSSAALMGLGVAGLLAFRLRRKV